MIRKQVYIEERHDRLLKRRARQRGVTEAEIIREALDRADVGDRADHLSDIAAGHKAISFIRSLARRRRKAPAGRGWTRESLYDERIGRWQKS
jgi:transcription elongation GreA/GreB family factor